MKRKLLLCISLVCSLNAFSNEFNEETLADQQDPRKVQLGKLLFYDKILSGNNNISCATCHHALAATGDGLSLSIGEGGQGLGIARNAGVGADEVHERVPRNAPHIFNIGQEEYIRMFADGRVEVDPYSPQGVKTPAGDDLPEGLDNLVAIQAMFPVTSQTEMAGQPGENPQADFAAAGNLPALWEHIASKLRAIPEYVDLFTEAFDDVDNAADITYVHAANAIAAFEIFAGDTTNSPYDRFMNGEKWALSRAQKKGMKIFNNRGGCVDCHSGSFQTDHEFYAIAVPQIGPGKGDGVNGQEDFGRERVTGNINDRYKFKTPTLRNIQITAPYGHDGAFDTLEAMIRHHLNPVESLWNYDKSQAKLPPRDDLDAKDFLITDDSSVTAAIAAANELAPRRLSKTEMKHLLDFLGALTDPKVLDMRNDVPTRVPSGLPVFD